MLFANLSATQPFENRSPDCSRIPTNLSSKWDCAPESWRHTAVTAESCEHTALVWNPKRMRHALLILDLPHCKLILDEANQKRTFLTLSRQKMAYVVRVTLFSSLVSSLTDGDIGPWWSCVLVSWYHVPGIQVDEYTWYLKLLFPCLWYLWHLVFGSQYCVCLFISFR